MNLYFLSQRLYSGGRVREHFVEFAESGRDVVGGGEEVFYFVDERGAWDAARVGVAKDNQLYSLRKVRCVCWFWVCHFGGGSGFARENEAGESSGGLIDDMRL